MALYQTDYSGYTADAQPSDWTARWTTSNSTWAVRAKSGTEGGQVLEHTSTADARRLLSWDVVDGDANRADVEVLARVRTSNSAVDQIRLQARASGAAGSETGYHLIFALSGGLQISKYTNGTAGTVAAAVSISWTTNTWYWLRFRVQGSSLKGKFWKDGDNEPPAWTVEGTDTGITAAGWVGVGNFESDGTRDFDYVAVATGGDTAPLGGDTTTVRLSQAPLEALLSGDPAAQLYHAALEVLVPYTGEEPPAGPKYVVVNIVT